MDSISDAVFSFPPSPPTVPERRDPRAVRGPFAGVLPGLPARLGRRAVSCRVPRSQDLLSDTRCSWPEAWLPHRVSLSQLAAGCWPLPSSRPPHQKERAQVPSAARLPPALQSPSQPWQDAALGGGVTLRAVEGRAWSPCPGLCADGRWGSRGAVPPQRVPRPVTPTVIHSALSLLREAPLWAALLGHPYRRAQRPSPGASSTSRRSTLACELGSACANAEVCLPPSGRHGGAQGSRCPVPGRPRFVDTPRLLPSGPPVPEAGLNVSPPHGHLCKQY